MFSVNVIRQQWVNNVYSKVFSVEARVDLLFRRKNLIKTSVKPICIRWNRNQCLVIDASEGGGQVRKRVILVEQRRCEWADSWNGKVRVRLSGGRVS